MERWHIDGQGSLDAWYAAAKAVRQAEKDAYKAEQAARKGPRSAQKPGQTPPAWSSDTTDGGKSGCRIEISPDGTGYWGMVLEIHPDRLPRR